MNQIKENKLTIGILLVCFLVFGFLLTYANSDPARDSGSTRESYTTYETAKVSKIISQKLEQSDLYEGSYTGSQSLMIEIKSGTYKGSTMSATNYLGALYGTKLKKGNSIVVAIYVAKGKVDNITVYEYDRSLSILVILGLFIIVTVIVGGRKGAQSLLGLVFSIVSLIWILIPLLMKGYPTVLTTFAICLYVAMVSYLLLGGITKKTICAMTGTASGLVLAILFGLAAQSVVKVNGMRMGDYLDALLQIKQGGTPLELKGLLIGGMIVASLGAIMDVAMSISSAMQELITVNPELQKHEMWRSGMNIGRDMIGTMTNTLILAFVGSSFVMVIYIWTLKLPLYELLSSNLVATELVHSIASSIGVILSVPLTVLISTFIYCQGKKVKSA
ncbi:integral membrane protein [Lachnospiraceae bacterium KM106-2]|nr:integral membrane protein [Lachnospiraceae bacterium KM106-2]